MYLYKSITTAFLLNGSATANEWNQFVLMRNYLPLQYQATFILLVN